MKKARGRLLRLINQTISIILATLGVSCVGQKATTTEANKKELPITTSSHPRNIIALYGIPYTTYQISGRVENQQGKPIQGIEVKDINSPSGVITDKQGTFSLTGKNRFSPDSIYITLQDVNKKNNEPYQNDTIGVTMNYKKEEGNNGWCIGNTTVDDLKIILEKKK